MIARRKKADVVHLRPPVPADPVFFNKADLHVGTRLRYWGASGHSEWIITNIVTLIRDHGHMREDSIETVRVQGDVIWIERLDKTHEVRHTSFSYLRYSAIWRIA